MENLERLTLAQMQEFTEGNRDVEFKLEGRAAAYNFLEMVLKAQRYRSLSKGQRGIVRGFLTKVTGFSRSQLTRLLRRWRRTRRVAGPPTYRPCFPRRYTAGDVALLASVDRQILRLIFLEERDKDEVCRIFQVNRNYLRVLLHRAKNRFRESLPWDSRAQSTKCWRGAPRKDASKSSSAAGTGSKSTARMPRHT